MKALTELIDLFTLTPLGDGKFQAKSQDLGLPQLFGGQLVAQSLAAAMAVVDEKRILHSCHAYFLQAGSAQSGICYETNLLREGNSFSVISVDAWQEAELLFRLNASFQLEEKGFEHQLAMPEAAQPSEFVDENTLLAQLATHLPEPLKKLFSQERAFDVAVKYANNPFQGKALPETQQLWAKTAGQLTCDRRMQQCLLAYFSDFHCIPTMLQPHECGVLQQKARFATLDHSIWFHRDFDFSQWLLFDLHTPTASGARGLTDGKVFDQQGRLVASYRQEGLIRPL